MTEEKEEVQKRSSAVSIGSKLKSMRIEANKTQAQMGRELDISEVSWRMYELGQRIPSDIVKMKIAKYFGMTADEFQTMFFDY